MAIYERKPATCIVTFASVALLLFSAPFTFLSPSPSRSLNTQDQQLVLGRQSPTFDTEFSSTGSSGRQALLAGAVFATCSAAFSVYRRSSPAKSSSISTCVLPKALEGTGGPMGDNVWDPAGLMNGRSEEQILHWRAVELKHCRVCMLAIVGWLHVSAGWHFIGDFAAGYRVSDDPLVNVTQVPMGGMWQLIFSIMGLEWLSSAVCPPPKHKPWDVLGWDRLIIDEGYEWKQKQLQELNNGRLAMLGILGLIGQDAFTGDYAAWIHQPNFGQSNPLDWKGEPPFEMPQLYPMANPPF